MVEEREDVKTWQHEDTGRITQCTDSPGPRWYEVHGYVEQDDNDGSVPSPYCTCNGDDTADEEELFSNRCKACGGQLV